MSTGELYNPFDPHIKDPLDPYRLPDIPSSSPSQPQIGWVCPKCGRVHAPWVSGCECTMDANRPTCYGVMD